MATTQKIQVDPQQTGLWKVKQTDESAKKASELLQHDLETHHVFFNQMGFHNHLVHQVLSLFGTGASSTVLQKGYDHNTIYQRPTEPLHSDVVTDLQNWDHAQRYLGREQHYPDFLAFFQREIDAREGNGWQAVLSKYALAGTEAADDLLVRLYAGFLHPLIQLMFGMEWAQPAIVAEALAQACVHQPNFKEVLLEAEKRADAAYGKKGEKGHMPRIVALLEEVRADAKLRDSVRMADDNKVRDGVLKRAPEEMTRIISKVKVRPEDLDERTAEMFDASLYTAAAASFHANKVNKFDFFLIHHVNSAPIFLTINAQPSIPVEVKARLLEWKIRYDLIQYAARGVPELSLDDLKAYQPKKTDKSSVADIMSRLHNFVEDDGHAIKLGRAAVICQETTKKYEDREWMVIKGDDLWMKVHHLIADSVEAPGETWVRTTGLEEAWSDIPNKFKL
ncbi:hypothetical protein M406DRAFT_344427 [Cryphonectria parasitica EP155]|uniref:HypA protein n=1 Tax=Cryphonectria parasitica (strain ATCC 38755 / EP155) TaxID=660469 RepID=A0A9P4YCF7_CRYP1|nr:uncharacterized protein M406DRAFT_344427 [Cryphonectria parasitica EP155]KAF3770979.1 hypothetical protein M406DRAFT_344427 [Cryphonectria parasitica EP155]